MVSKPRLECDFCGKWDSEVKVMIDGANAAICNECVSQAYDLCVKHIMAGELEYKSWGVT